MYQFKLPDVGEGIHEAEILRWLVAVGDRLTMNQPILEIQTDKAVVEIPSPVAGEVVEITAQTGAMAQVGDVLITITTTEDKPAPEKKTARAKPSLSVTRGGGIAGPGKRVLAAPAVRKMALEMGVDLAQVSGTGPAGRVLPGDVQQFIQQKPQESPPLPEPKPPLQIHPATPPSPPPPISAPSSGKETSAEEPLHGIPRRMAERMEMAWRIPHVTLFEEFDASGLVALRQSLKTEAEKKNVRLTYLPFIIKATAQALKEFPYFNASLDMEAQKIIKHGHYHMGIATDTPQGLLVPVLRHADRLTLTQLAAELNRLAEMARQRKLTQAELTGSTFSITNFGSFGSYQGTPIINPPEVAILGVGKITEKPVAAQSQIKIRPVLPLALSFDHRLIDGATGARFLNRVKALLSNPNLIFLEMA